MRPDIFYQENSKNTLPLVLVSSKQWEEGASFIPKKEKEFLKAQQFQAKSGEIAYAIHADAKRNKIYYGRGDDDEDLALATAANKLPAGAYRIEQDLPDFAWVIWSLAQYRYDAFKENTTAARVLFVPEKKFSKVLQEAQVIFLVRDLINAPANIMTPEALSKVSSDMAARYEASFEEWVGEDLLTANFPAIHTVGRASMHKPRLIRLLWGNNKHPRIALVGKGVCFDSGGLDLKPADGMRLMKKDMGGAAQVLGLAEWIMSMQLPVYLDVLIPAVENVIGSAAFRPGDIIKMRNGLTVEIDNTDAEGRLVLADALVFACESKPELIVDFATLTGAARVAVGTEISAMFSNEDTLATNMSIAAKEVQDPVWRLPLFKGYESMFKSSVADMSNCCLSSYAGAITAALFLQRYIPSGMPWLHFDMMAWNLSAKPGKPEGGEAMGIRALAHYLQKKYQTHHHRA